MTRSTQGLGCLTKWMYPELVNAPRPPRAHLGITQLHFWSGSVFHIHSALHTFLLSSTPSWQNSMEFRQSWDLNPYSANHWYVSFSK